VGGHKCGRHSIPFAAGDVVVNPHVADAVAGVLLLAVLLGWAALAGFHIIFQP